MKTYFMLFFTWACIACASEGVFTPIQTFPSSYTENMLNLYSSYNSKDNLILFSWSDNTAPVHPWYAFYDCKTGSFKVFPTQINTSSNAITVTNCYNSHDNTMVICWKNSSGNPYFCIIDCTTQQFTVQPTQISNDNVDNEIYLCYNQKDNTVFFSWNMNVVVYAVYNCTTSSFSVNRTATTIPSTEDVIPIYIPYNNSIFISTAYSCSIYDCNSNTFTTTNLQIPGVQIGSNKNIFSSYIAQQKQIFLTSVSPATTPWYAIYDIQQNKFVVEGTSINAPAQYNVLSCYNPVTNSVMLTWGDGYGAYYSIYNCKNNTFSETPALIPNSSGYDNFDLVVPIYCSKASNVFVSWALGTYQGVYTTYTHKKSAVQKWKNRNKTYYQKGL